MLVLQLPKEGVKSKGLGLVSVRLGDEQSVGFRESLEFGVGLGRSGLERGDLRLEVLDGHLEVPVFLSVLV